MYVWRTPAPQQLLLRQNNCQINIFDTNMYFCFSISTIQVLKAKTEKKYKKNKKIFKKNKKIF